MSALTLPALGEDVTGGTVARVLVQPGESIAAGQGIVELETDKATVEVPAARAGVVRAVVVKAGDVVKVGSVVLELDGDNAVPVQPAAAASAAAATPAHAGAPSARPEAVSGSATPVPMPIPVSGSAPRPTSVAPASPRVRRLAREIGVDVDAVAGSGPEGRITQHDVKAYARQSLSHAGVGLPGSVAAASVPDVSAFGPVERRPMTPVRRATAVHLAQAWATVPQVTQTDAADITELEAIRKRLAPDVEPRGGKLTMTAILVKVLASAVREFPQFNAVVDMATETVVYRQYVNVGVAVDTDRGLLVPVVKGADRMGVGDIAVEVRRLAARARDRKLSLEEMSGGGISISNLGGIGGGHFTPIVNWPEVAILGVSRGAMTPVWRAGSFEPRLMLPLSLSYDHRLIDGADGIRFLRWICEALEQPWRLALGE